MSYGTIKAKIKCDCCGYVSQDSIPGVYYMDMFYKHKCSSCEGDALLCSSCTGQHSEHIEGEWRTDCKSCARDMKIDKIIDGKN